MTNRFIILVIYFIYKNMDDSWQIGQSTQKENTSGHGQRGKQQEKEVGVDWNDEDDEKVYQLSQPQEKKQSKNSKLDQSDWLSNVAPTKQGNNFKENNKRGDFNPSDTSFLNGVDQPFVRQLSREDPNTTWVVEDTNSKSNQQNQRDPPSRGNRNRDQGEKQPPRRGNREFQDQKKEDGQGPRRGNRYRETGGEGNFKKKRTDNEYYQPTRQNNYDRNERGGYRGGRGNRGRGGYNNYNNNYSTSNYNNSNNYNKGFRPKYQEQSQSKNNNPYLQREQRGNRYQRKNEGNYNGYQGYNNNNYNNYNRNYNTNNSNKSSQITQIQHKVIVKQPEIQKEVQKTNKVTLGQTALMLAKGRKCWPESSINILGCKFVTTLRHLVDFRCKLLVVPYSTVQMEYYPGNAVNSSTVDYRKKILSKGSVIEKQGSVYLQKAFGVYSFQALAFLKINKLQVEQSLRVGIKELLRMAEIYQKPITLESIVFAICDQLGDPSWVIDPFFEHLQNCRRVKEVWITTIQGECYVRAAGAFTKQVEKIFRANQIFVN